MDPVFLGIVLVPAAVAGAAAAAFAHGPRRLAVLVGAGVLLAGLFVLVVYLRAPTGHEPSGCSDCGRYLGRWWEPAVALVVAAFGLAGWLGGTLVGAAVTRLLRRT